jgi:hypothetical protein
VEASNRLDASQGVFPVYVLPDDHCVHDGEDPGPPVVVLFHLFEIGKESSDLR